VQETEAPVGRVDPGNRQMHEGASDPLLVITTGSSGTILFPSYLVKLRDKIECRIRVLMTQSAERFVSPEVVGWFAHEVVTSDAPGVNPVELALKSRGIVVLPATANTLACAALGLALTPASTALLASQTPCIFFPQMNPLMWEKRIVQQHVAALRDEGHVVVEPEVRDIFEIWCGKIQKGYSMPLPDRVAELVGRWLSDSESSQESGPA
jgi:phosphopantothenoylcysteine synthetase/decarboxylase